MIHEEHEDSRIIQPHLLVIACGNSLRGDDGAGLLLAERLVTGWRAAGLSVQHVAVQQLTPELAESIAADGVAAVVFVDTAVGQTERGIAVQQVSANDGTPSLGHHLDPTLLLLYAQHLYAQQPPAWLVTIPGEAFGLGEELSPVVQRIIANAAPVAERVHQQIREYVNQPHQSAVPAVQSATVQ